MVWQTLALATSSSFKRLANKPKDKDGQGSLQEGIHGEPVEVLDLLDTNIYHGHIQIKPDARSALEPMYIQHNPHTFPKDPSSSKIHKESKI